MSEQLFNDNVCMYSNGSADFSKVNQIVLVFLIHLPLPVNAQALSLWVGLLKLLA